MALTTRDETASTGIAEETAPGVGQRRTGVLSPRLLLRTEGVVLLAAAAASYYVRDGSLLLFVVLLLAPDLSMAGYLANERVGAAAYNAVHSLLGPAALLGLGLAGAIPWAPVAVDLALIWIAHVGLDRAVGLGLKYPTGFRDTHLNRV